MSRHRNFWNVFATAVVAGVALPSVCARVGADVVVLANRTAHDVKTRVTPRGNRPFPLEIASGAVVPIFCEGAATLTLLHGGREQRFDLDANSAYFFGRTARKEIALRKIGLGGDAASRRGRRLPGSANVLGSIGVTIAVDEEEPAKRPVWEARLRKRLAAASEIFERHCRVRIEVVRATTWDSDDKSEHFFSSLAEFEREVSPLPGRLAIGFTSQYRAPKGRTHLGGTRGPLRSHILIREWSQHVSEPERLELVVHELGHFFGAAHSPEGDSVMRPVLGDRKSIRAGFSVRFDPVNALAMNIIAEEIRRRGIRTMSQLSPESKRRLRQIYGALAKALPDDKSPLLYRQLMYPLSPPAAAHRRNAPSME